MTSDAMYQRTTSEQAQRRKRLAPKTHEAFEAFSEAVFADGALPEKTKQLIAVAVAHTTQCPFCIDGHTKLAMRTGASPEEVMEAIWVAAEMRAGGAYAHATLALNAMEHSASRREPEMAGVGQGTAVAVAEQRGPNSASRPSFDPRKDVDARVGYQGRSTLATAPPYPDNI